MAGELQRQATWGLGLGNLLGGFWDRLEGKQERGIGLGILESMQGEGGLASQIRGQAGTGMQKQEQLGTAAQERLTGWEDWQAKQPSFEQAATGVHQNVMAGVQSRSDARMAAATAAGGKAMERAEANYNMISQNLDDHFQATQANVAAGIQAATDRFDTDIASMEGRWDLAIQNFQGAAVAATEEAFGSAEAGFTEAKTSINAMAAAGQITPQQAAMLQTQAQGARDNGLMAVAHTNRARDSQILGQLDANWGATTGTMMSNASQSLASMRTAGAGIVAQTGTQIEQVRTQAAQNLSATELAINDSIDAGWQFSNQMLAQYDQSGQNNILRGLEQDVNLGMLVQQTTDGIRAQTAATDLAITTTTNDLYMQAVMADADINKMMAEAHFGWQNSTITMQQVFGNAMSSTGQLLGAQPWNQGAGGSGMAGTLGGSAFGAATTMATAGIIAGGGGAGGAAGAAGAAATAPLWPLIFACWTAAELYGSWEDPRTLAARLYISTEAPTWLRRAYLAHGEWVAGWMRRWKPVRWLVGPIVNYWTRLGMRQARLTYQELTHG